MPRTTTKPAAQARARKPPRRTEARAKPKRDLTRIDELLIQYIEELIETLRTLTKNAGSKTSKADLDSFASCHKLLSDELVLLLRAAGLAQEFEAEE